VTGHNSSSEVDLRPEDVILIDVLIDLTSGASNPLDKARPPPRRPSHACLPDNLVAQAALAG